MRKLSVYIHIPFCMKKCLYCDFLSFAGKEAFAGTYIEALQKEIETEAFHYSEYEIGTVFIGGGTPSAIEAVYIESILCKLKEHYRFVSEPEITIEVNPGTVDEKKLRKYRIAGINRLSIGVQSLKDEELKRLGRVHNADDFYFAYENARKAGFSNINVDIMSALPGQTIEAYKETILSILQLRPEHISAYSLIIEEGTPFYEQYGENRLNINNVSELPSEEEERLMYEETEKVLMKFGYHRYEISNYCLGKRECRHNMAYWKRHDYVGFGLGAASMIDNVRFKNEENLYNYVNQCGNDRKIIKRDIQKLSESEQMEEFMFLGLRLTEGVSRKNFKVLFHKDIDEVYGEILKTLCEQKLIETDENIALTPFGRDVSNYVMGQFLF